MSKRTRTDSVQTNPKNFWPTPAKAVVPVLDYLPQESVFVEPCAGDGSILYFLMMNGHRCADAFDLESRVPAIRTGDGAGPLAAGMVITNPPWAKVLLTPLLDAWAQRECWLLLPSDNLMNVWFAPYCQRATRILPLGRVKWIEGSSDSGMENSCWIHLTPGGSGLLLPRRQKLRKSKRGYG